MTAVPGAALIIHIPHFSWTSVLFSLVDPACIHNCTVIHYCFVTRNKCTAFFDCPVNSCIFHKLSCISCSSLT